MGSEKFTQTASAIGTNRRQHQSATPSLWRVSELLQPIADRPWTWITLLCAAGLVLAWMGVQAGRWRWLVASASCGVAAVAVALVARFVPTPALMATQCVRGLAAAAEAGDIAAARGHFAPDASWHMRSRERPGVGRERIDAALGALGSRHRIESNEEVALEASTEAPDLGVVEVGFRTVTSSSYGMVPTRWRFEVRRGSDGAWRIERITWLTLAGRDPPDGGW
jgi:hypothetical protein